MAARGREEHPAPERQPVSDSGTRGVGAEREVGRPRRGIDRGRANDLDVSQQGIGSERVDDGESSAGDSGDEQGRGLDDPATTDADEESRNVCSLPVVVTFADSSQ